MSIFSGLINLDALPQASDDAVAAAIAELQQAQRDRALARGDIDAVVEQAFATRFTPGATPVPYLQANLLICCGVKIDRGMNHDCGFVSVDGTWSWEHSDAIVDVVRRGTAKGRPVMTTVTVLPVVEGTTLTHVVARTKSGIHHVRSAIGYTITNGQLIQSGTSAPNAGAHAHR